MLKLISTFDDLSRRVYALVVSRMGLFAILAVLMVALMVGLGAATELMQASAEPRPGMPTYTCTKYYGVGGNWRWICYVTG